VIVKRLIGGLLAGALLGTAGGLAQGEVVLPPTDEEVAALEEAFGQVTSFFTGFILEIRGSLTTLDKRVVDLERASLVFQLGLKDLAGRILSQEGQLTGLAGRLTAVERAIEGAIGPKIVDLDRRLSVLETYDYPSLERRLAALDKTSEALSVRIDNNRAKIEGLETVLVGLTTGLEERLAQALQEVQVETATQRQEIETMKSELARLAQAQQAQWTAIFLVPLAVGGLLFLLLTAGS
jgi:chromosome segregation ATPase